MTADADRQRRAAAERMARTRERRRRGAFVLTVEISAEVVAALEDAYRVDIETSAQAAAALARHMALFASADRPPVARNATRSTNVLHRDQEAKKC